MKRSWIGLMATLALLATGCGASGGEQGEGEEGPTTTAEAGGGSTGADFGTVEAPCGPGEATIKADEGGRGTDKLYLGVGNDRKSQIRPGLLKELWDASVGFAAWCNAQGGIGGLQIELVDLDSELLSVEAAMATACGDVFAMVGGGMVQDNLQYSGKEGSDFHLCKLIDIPAFAVSPAKTDGNGQIQPVPNPAYSVITTWTRDVRTLYPDIETVAMVWGDLPSLQIVAERQKVAVRESGLRLVGDVKYSPLEVDFLPTAQQVIDSNADLIMYVGEPENASKLAKELADQGWKGKYLFETNIYDPKFFANGPEVVEGSLVRSAFHPLEEADRWPAVAKYIEIARAATPDAKIAMLGQQSISAWLLFATAANRCIERDGGELSRVCILEEAAAEDEWTGGGMHAPTDPGKPIAVSCGMLLEARNGEFVRRFPEIGGEGDDRAGFHCPENALAEMTVDVGKGNIDPSRPPIEG